MQNYAKDKILHAHSVIGNLFLHLKSINFVLNNIAKYEQQSPVSRLGGGKREILISNRNHNKSETQQSFPSSLKSAWLRLIPNCKKLIRYEIWENFHFQNHQNNRVRRESPLCVCWERRHLIDFRFHRSQHGDYRDSRLFCLTSLWLTIPKPPARVRWWVETRRCFFYFTSHIVFPSSIARLRCCTRLLHVFINSMERPESAINHRTSIREDARSLETLLFPDTQLSSLLLVSSGSGEDEMDVFCHTMILTETID